MSKRNKTKKSKKPVKRITHEEFEKIVVFADNDYVDDFNMHTGKFTYTKRFYMDLYKLVSEQGLTYVQAYNKLGFDTSVLGENRANSAGKRAAAMAKEGTLYTISPENYDGSKSKEYYGKMTPEEELAYYKARCSYLDTVVEVQKKMPSELLARLTLLKNSEE